MFSSGPGFVQAVPQRFIQGGDIVLRHLDPRMTHWSEGDWRIAGAAVKARRSYLMIFFGCFYVCVRLFVFACFLLPESDILHVDQHQYRDKCNDTKIG